MRCHQYWKGPHSLLPPACRLSPRPLAQTRAHPRSESVHASIDTDQNHGEGNDGRGGGEKGEGGVGWELLAVFHGPVLK